MSTAAPPSPAPAGAAIQTVADLLHQLGDIPPQRVLWNPRPGTATEADAIRFIDGDEKRLVELVDGTLVEKPMGQYQARLALVLGRFLDEFLEVNDRGVAYGPDATLRVLPGLIRLPDVSFVSWDQLPGRELPAEAVANLFPDIAVEILSTSNTPAEMARKRREYFTAGTRLVWQIDPDAQTARVYTSAEDYTLVEADGELDGGDVLPGFRLSMQRLFGRAGRRRGS
jgi:Uma2 family endonuclease